MRSLFKYPGAKWKIAQRIVGFFPEHHSYLEPFFGSGAVLFNKERSNIETVNDISGDIVNLFRCVKEDPERLAHDIYLTPYAHDVFDKAWYEQSIVTDPYDRALNFLIRASMSFGFRQNGTKNGWKKDVQGREKSYATFQWCRTPEVIIDVAERLRGVQIDNRPAVELIRQFNYQNVLIYADPPYMLSTRNGGNIYANEMSDEDHIELLDVLKHHKGPVLISGYYSDLYLNELNGWHTETIKTTDQLSRIREEVLWMNFIPNGEISIYDNDYL